MPNGKPNILVMWGEDIGPGGDGRLLGAATAPAQPFVDESCREPAGSGNARVPTKLRPGITGS